MTFWKINSIQDRLDRYNGAQRETIKNNAYPKQTNILNTMEKETTNIRPFASLD